MQVFSLDLTGAITSQFAALSHGITSYLGKEQIGKAVMDAVKEHFITLNGERHHSWSRSIGYYADAAKNTDMEITPEGVEVVTSKEGLGLRIAGGVVTPGKNPSCITGKPTQYLTIPAIAEAYGNGACSFSGLQFVKFGKAWDAPAALMEKKPKSVTWSSSGRRVKNVLKQSKGQGSYGRRIWFWLVRSTKHTADPSVLPDFDKLEQVAIDAMEKYAAGFA